MSELAIIEETTKALAVLPEEKDLDTLFLEDAGDGLENVTASDLKIAYLKLIQSTSPELKPSNPKYNKDAKQGQLIDSITGELFDQVDFIPCGFKKEVVEWHPRDSGRKGIVNRFDFNGPDSEGAKQLAKASKNDKGVLLSKDGNEVRETYVHTGILVRKDGSNVYAIIASTSTNIKHSKTLLSLLAQSTVKTPNGEVTAPSYANVVSVESQAENNTKGDFFCYRFLLAGKVTSKALYAKAREWAKIVKTRKIELDEEDLDTGGHAPNVGSTEDTPF